MRQLIPSLDIHTVKSSPHIRSPNSLSIFLWGFIWKHEFNPSSPWQPFTINSHCLFIPTHTLSRLNIHLVLLEIVCECVCFKEIVLNSLHTLLFISFSQMCHAENNALLFRSFDWQIKVYLYTHISWCTAQWFDSHTSWSDHHNKSSIYTYFFSLVIL